MITPFICRPSASAPLATKTNKASFANPNPPMTSYFKGQFMERIRLKLKAYDHRVLDRTVSAIVDAVRRTGADIRGPIPMPTKLKRYTVLKSPHINKDSREQFEMRIHGRMLDILAATPDTVDSLTKLDLAPEVNVEVRALGNK